MKNAGIVAGQNTNTPPAKPALTYSIAFVTLLKPLSIMFLVEVICAIYINSLFTEFVYDDMSDIVGNPSILHLWPTPIWSNGAIQNRPLANFSFALNYALGGMQVKGYHVVNLVIHIINALLLFGILRRTFLLPTMRAAFGGAAWILSLTISLLWAVHPLQTEAVTYIVQRYESLMSLFYLLVFYYVIRGVDSHRPTIWYVGAILACFLGMSTKEVMVTAPVMVFLYDRTFLTGSFQEAFKQRWWLYVGLALCWVWLLKLINAGWMNSALNSTAVNVRGGVSDTWSYAATQPGVILHYLRLIVWPNPLILDYNWPVANTLPAILRPGAVILLLVLAWLWGLFKHRTWAFLIAWFLIILSPTSSFFPLFDDYVVEHRMYLPSIAPIAFIVIMCYRGIREAVIHQWVPQKSLKALLVPAILATITFGALTRERNKDYANESTMWTNVVTKVPNNSRAQNNLGVSLYLKNRPDEAIVHLQEALRLKPDSPGTHNNLGNALTMKNQYDEAIKHYQEALRLRPDYPEANNNLGNAFTNLNRPDEAIKHYQEALRQWPNYPHTRCNLETVRANLRKQLSEIKKQ